MDLTQCCGAARQTGPSPRWRIPSIVGCPLCGRNGPWQPP